MIKVEDKLVNSLEQRLSYLKNISKNKTDSKVLQGYFETKLNRVILDYFLQNQMFNTSRVFSQETCIEVFSNIDIFIETYEIIEKLDIVITEEGNHFDNEASDIKANKLKNTAIDIALGWCNTYKTKL